MPAASIRKVHFFCAMLDCPASQHTISHNNNIYVTTAYNLQADTPCTHGIISPNLHRKHSKTRKT
jgi:hypothetical protein